MNPEDFAWIILFLPLVAAVVITLFTQREPRLSAQLSIGAVVLSFVVSIWVFMIVRVAGHAELHLGQWLQVGRFGVDFGLRLDPLSVLMVMVVTGVAGAIHIYSWGYMGADSGFSRYFAGLSLFTFSMLGIVLANNFVMMFIFWELVGLSSYLLIGFWYKRLAAADACKKAFLTNRLGDYGFLLGIILIWGILGSVQFDVLESKLTQHPEALGVYSTIAGLLIFCGAVGKSAQFPLHVWLPDAMEGPTPVSALIHAATMVAAGVYMLCRVFFIYQATPSWPDCLSCLHGLNALQVIAWTGGLTALLAALIAVQQDDIKRILAYSTLSQLGYMIMTVGLHGPSPAMYHLTTHAFFKALLFLGAGSVIHMLHHEQNIWRMGGLKQKMPVTYWTFLLATLALCGFPGLSGFYSKDEVLATAWHQNTALFVLATLVALLTTLYMFRLVFVAFGGEARTDAAQHAHESPPVMSWVLLVLSVPTLLAGFWGLPDWLNRQFDPAHPAVALAWYHQVLAPIKHAPAAAAGGLAALIFGFAFAYGLYAKATKDPLPDKLGLFSRAMRNRFYFDEIYDWLIGLTHEAVSRLAAVLDRWVIAGFGVRGTHGTFEAAGRMLRQAQTGNVQTYAFWVALGLALVLFFVLIC